MSCRANPTGRFIRTLVRVSWVTVDGSQITLRKLSDFVSGDSQVILRIPPDNSQAWEIVLCSGNPHLILRQFSGSLVSWNETGVSDSETDNAVRLL